MMRFRTYNKYKNKRIVRNDGEAFDSKLESRRFDYLKWLEKDKRIENLHRQVKIDLSTAKGFTCYYKADFVYYDHNGFLIVEDCKGMVTDTFKVKFKWLMTKYKGFTFRVVKNAEECDFKPVGELELCQYLKDFNNFENILLN